MGSISTSQDIKRLGTILSIWAHPDDETFCAAGIMHSAINNGQKVVCITATRGEKGSQDHDLWPASEMGEVRSRELKAALKIIGVKEHHWLDYNDGECSAADPEEAGAKLAQLIDKFRPDSILTFGPDGLTGHPDHCAVSNWVKIAVVKSSFKPNIYHAVVTVEQYIKYLQTADEKLDIFYNIDQPPLAEDADCDICLCCDESTCNCKHEAFQAMPSQMSGMSKALGPEFMKQAFKIEAFVSAEK